MTNLDVTWLVGNTNSPHPCPPKKQSSLGKQNIDVSYCNGKISSSPGLQIKAISLTQNPLIKDPSGRTSQSHKDI